MPWGDFGVGILGCLLTGFACVLPMEFYFCCFWMMEGFGQR